MFTMLGLSIAAAKTYEITIDNAMKAGTVTLKPGRYNMKVDAAKVMFTDDSGKSVEATGKVVTADKKFDNTMVDSKQVNGVAEIREIDLGGTKTKIQFSE
jgi:hypothetical protein